MFFGTCTTNDLFELVNFYTRPSYVKHEEVNESRFKYD